MTDPTTLSEYGLATDPRGLRFERLLPGRVERIWRYLTDSEMRGKWLGSGPMEQFPGGAVTLQFNHASLSPMKEDPPERFKGLDVRVTGRVLRCEPPRLLAFTWGEGPDASEVTFELTPQGKDVLLTLTQIRLASRAEMVDVAAGWHTHLAILADNAEGRTPRPFWATWTGKEDEYDKRLPKG
jgi:uncharacterized protein YndB with AHSA1/START domain